MYPLPSIMRWMWDFAILTSLFIKEGLVTS